MTRVLIDYPHRMGGHCGSGAFRDLLEWAKLGWHGPPTEGLTFALSGSLDFTYVRSHGMRPPIYLVGRGGDLELDLPRRLGATVNQGFTDDPTLGWDWVRSELDSGWPALIWADIAELPYLRVRLRMSRHDIVIIGYDEDLGIAHVVDNDREHVQEVPYSALAKARASTSFPVPTRHAMYFIDWPSQLPDLRSVAADAFDHAARTMRTPGRPGLNDTIVGDGSVSSAGLDGVQAFADDIAQWPNIYQPEVLDHVLLGVTAFIEKAGTGGGLFRRLLADGCDYIAHATDDQATRTAAHAARQCADTWTALATKAANRPDGSRDAATRANDAALIAAALPDLERQLAVELANAAESLSSHS